MPQKPTVPAALSGHIQFLARIYTFLGWLGLLGSAIMIFGLFSQQATPGDEVRAGVMVMPPAFAVFLLICWSMLLLNFSKDITGQRKWSTGPGGLCIALLNLLSIPVGTAVGMYTLWILLRNRQLH